ncbi:transposase [Streptomyces sp. NPDC090022]|uniref:transposase n=1 Tax=Streptomyces sp. NPDC090022 TaxID=3365920 RepID=UPI0037F317B6
MVDLEARRPIDVLPGREAATVARWLEGHPEVEITCRDRASAYAEAARAAAPQAVQIADWVRRAAWATTHRGPHRGGGGYAHRFGGPCRAPPRSLPRCRRPAPLTARQR